MFSCTVAPNWNYVTHTLNITTLLYSVAADSINVGSRITHNHTQSNFLATNTRPPQVEEEQFSKRTKKKSSVSFPFYSVSTSLSVGSSAEGTVCNQLYSINKKM